MEIMKKLILILWVLSFASVGWGADCGGVTECGDGDTVTSDYTLTADLNCESAGPCLSIVETDDIDLNLGGYTISGDGTNTTNVILVDGSNNFTITNGTVTGGTEHGIYVTTGGSGGQNLTAGAITDITTHTNDLSGVYFWSEYVSQSVAGIVITDSVAHTNGRSGFDARVNTSTGISFVGCTAYGNGGSIAGHGFHMSALYNSYTSGWTDADGGGPGTVYTRTINNAETQKVIDKTNNVVLTEGDYTSLGNNEFDWNSNTLYVNIGGDANAATLNVQHRPMNGCSYTRCLSYDNLSTGAGEGHGFSFDDFASGMVADRVRAWGNEGSGLNNQWGDNAVVKNSIFYDNDLGGIRCTGFVTSFDIINNTIANNTQQGVNLGTNALSDIILTNNIISENTFYGVAVTAGEVANVTIDYNLTYNNTLGNIQNDTQTNEITTDPLFISATDFRLSPGSPAINTGSDGFDIGAYPRSYDVKGH